MAAPFSILFAGFGGQGILFAGKLAAHAGLIDGREVSWLPSYGPEMRGGTANCSVCLDDEPIGSPLVTEPDALVVMNQPALERFFSSVAPGGTVIVDTTMAPRVPERGDIRVFALPATQMAEDAGLKGLANVILVGKLLAETGFCSPEALDEAITASVPPKRQQLLAPNRDALALGRSCETAANETLAAAPSANGGGAAEAGLEEATVCRSETCSEDDAVVALDDGPTCSPQR